MHAKNLCNSIKGFFFSENKRTIRFNKLFQRIKDERRYEEREYDRLSDLNVNYFKPELILSEYEQIIYELSNNDLTKVNDLRKTPLNTILKYYYFIKVKELNELKFINKKMESFTNGK